MTVSSTDALVFAEVALASGRIAYSVTRDDIFRPVREWVYARSAPDSDTILVRDDSGDHEYPARLFHRVDAEGYPIVTEQMRQAMDVEGYNWSGTDVPAGVAYFPHLPPREPGWAGCLIECPYCFSFWTSLALTLLWLLVGSGVMALLAAPFAVWAVANAYAVKGL